MLPHRKQGRRCNYDNRERHLCGNTHSRLSQKVRKDRKRLLQCKVNEYIYSNCLL
uniref:Uncharacterized protein n=1 Tax=Anguilla anguilla TaxID=7936 RepID=A0A0E9VZD4_ANGAN